MGSAASSAPPSAEPSIRSSETPLATMFSGSAATATPPPSSGPRRLVRPSQRGREPGSSGIRFSCPGPVARVPAAALPEGRRSACLAAGSTRRPRKRAHAGSGRRNTSPGPRRRNATAPARLAAASRTRSSAVNLGRLVLRRRALLHLGEGHRRRLAKWGASRLESCKKSSKRSITSVASCVQEVWWRTSRAVIARCNSACC